MTYVIGSECVDVMDKSCVQECPVDCIYEGARMLYINPDECVDCGACKPACRVEAIYWEGDLPDDQHQHLGDNAAFFHQVLPGRVAPLGSPGGAAAVGPIESTRLWSRLSRWSALSRRRRAHNTQRNKGDRGRPSFPGEIVDPPCATLVTCCNRLRWCARTVAAARGHGIRPQLARRLHFLRSMWRFGH